MISKAVTAVIRIGIRFYQRILNPMLKAAAGPAAGCRFSPTCSHYFLGAVETHGPLKGSWLGICRIFRCHPWGGSGYDPVPPVRTSGKTGHGCSCKGHQPHH
ncbi:MAG TPA: membrane protein insertion efficiency factor YidD [Luteolibacter sp.]|nr:membrane protein insertion efficiency factor YidD [Luteolibacter sp.]